MQGCVASTIEIFLLSINGILKGKQKAWNSTKQHMDDSWKSVNWEKNSWIFANLQKKHIYSNCDYYTSVFL